MTWRSRRIFTTALVVSIGMVGLRAQNADAQSLRRLCRSACGPTDRLRVRRDDDPS